MDSVFTRQVLLRLTEEEYQRVAWLSEKLEIGNFSETIRKLIPNIEPQRRRVLPEEQAAEATSYDFIAVSESFDAEQLDTLLGRIEAKHQAVTRARELRQQLLNQERGSLTVETVKRLSRWCHPNRHSARELTISPIAKDISKVLFGKVIDRID